MCYMLDIITNKEISKQEIKDYSKNCSISIYDKTSNMINAESGKFYYLITELGHCACGFHNSHPSNGTQLINLLKDCLEYGEVVLFFYWDDGDYHAYSNNVYKYIRKVKKVRISSADFFDIFMTKEFVADNVVYIIENNMLDESGQRSDLHSILDSDLNKEYEYRDDNMCYMLDIITHRDVPKHEAKQYYDKYGIKIYEKTAVMEDAEINKHYYSIITTNHCACEFLQNRAGIGKILTDLLEDCTYYGEVILLFYWGKEEYHLYENDVYSYIKKAKNVHLCYKDFLYEFMSKKFNVDDVVYIIEKTVAHDG